MKSNKGSRKIVVNDTEYRWRATGDDGYINVGVWPSNNIGSYIHGNFEYHQTWLPRGDNSYSSLGDQIVITSKIVRRVILYAISEYNYDPLKKAKELNLTTLDDVIKWDDVIRANEIRNSSNNNEF